MSRCKRCGVIIDFDDEWEAEAFNTNGECHGCCQDGENVFEELDEDVRKKWMEGSDEGMQGLW